MKGEKKGERKVGSECKSPLHFFKKSKNMGFPGIKCEGIMLFFLTS